MSYILVSEFMGNNSFPPFLYLIPMHACISNKTAIACRRKFKISNEVEFAFLDFLTTAVTIELSIQ
jgi:hypothetical protein